MANITPLQRSIEDEVRTAGPNHLQALLGVLTVLKIEEPEITENNGAVVVRVGGSSSGWPLVGARSVRTLKAAKNGAAQMAVGIILGQLATGGYSAQAVLQLKTVKKGERGYHE